MQNSHTSSALCEQPIKTLHLGILTGLASESAIASKLWPGAQIACAASRVQLAEDGAARLISEGATCLMSFGIAGALAPTLRPGTVIIADHLITHNRTYPCAAHLCATLMQNIPTALKAPIFGATEIIVSPEEKNDLFRTTGAVAVDMESAALAEAAAQANLPFVIIRAIADRAGDIIPSVVQDALDLEGRPMIGRVVGRLLRHPGQIFSLIALGRASHQAHEALAALPKNILLGG